MFDDDDAMWAALSLPFGGRGAPGIIVFLLGLAIFIFVLANISSDADQCSKMSCPAGSSPKVMKHECLCVQRAAP